MTGNARPWPQTVQGRLAGVLGGGGQVFGLLSQPSGTQRWSTPSGRLLWPPGEDEPAPWLVPGLDAMAFDEAWPAGGLAWLVADASRASGLDATWRHLRRFTRARDPQGRVVAWRFHDPRVLRLVLPELTAVQLAAFFGPVQAWITPDDDGTGAHAGAVVWSLAHGRLLAERLPPDTAGDAGPGGNGESAR